MQVGGRHHHGEQSPVLLASATLGAAHQLSLERWWAAAASPFFSVSKLNTEYLLLLAWCFK